MKKLIVALLFTLPMLAVASSAGVADMLILGSEVANETEVIKCRCVRDNKGIRCISGNPKNKPFVCIGAPVEG